jgi:hypothetical protein
MPLEEPLQFLVKSAAVNAFVIAELNHPDLSARVVDARVSYDVVPQRPQCIPLCYTDAPFCKSTADRTGRSDGLSHHTCERCDTRDDENDVGLIHGRLLSA